MEHFGKNVFLPTFYRIYLGFLYCEMQKKKKIKSEGAGKIRELEGKRIIHGNSILLLPRYPRAF